MQPGNPIAIVDSTSPMGSLGARARLDRAASATLGLMAWLYAVCCMAGDEEVPVKLPAKEKFHLFLLAGQSNMAGRGTVAAEDRRLHPRVLALAADGTWKPAVDPVHYDKKGAGVGPGKAFAVALAEADPDMVIGLIPAACGGSPIATWEPGKEHAQTNSHPYDDAIKRAQLAMKDGVLKGILWHQGESDCNPTAAAVYTDKLQALIERFRHDLNAPAVPFIIGQLGQFAGKAWTNATRQVNAAHIALAKAIPLCGFVGSDSLAANPDNVHFSAEAQREFGRRYAKVYLQVAQANTLPAAQAAPGKH